MEQLKLEIERLRQTMLVERRYRTGMSMKKLQLFKQELDGKWQFAHAVMPEDETIYQLKDEIENAFNPPENFESVDWLDMPYSFF
jgi:PHP family Zn ribbon phosphoesterase